MNKNLVRIFFLFLCLFLSSIATAGDKEGNGGHPLLIRYQGQYTSYSQVIFNSIHDACPPFKEKHCNELIHYIATNIFSRIGVLNFQNIIIREELKSGRYYEIINNTAHFKESYLNLLLDSNEIYYAVADIIKTLTPKNFKGINFQRYIHHNLSTCYSHHSESTYDLKLPPIFSFNEIKEWSYIGVVNLYNNVRYVPQAYSDYLNADKISRLLEERPVEFTFTNEKLFDYKGSLACGLSSKNKVTISKACFYIWNNSSPSIYQEFILHEFLRAIGIQDNVYKLTETFLTPLRLCPKKISAPQRKEYLFQRASLIRVKHVENYFKALSKKKSRTLQTF
jgi:hypothetical protein